MLLIKTCYKSIDGATENCYTILIKCCIIHMLRGCSIFQIVLRTRGSWVKKGFCWHRR